MIRTRSVSFRGFAAIAIAGGFCTACAGGEEEAGGPGGGGGSPADPSASFTAKASFDAADVDHLLLRTGFGIEPAVREEVDRVGVAEFVDAMLEFPVDGSSNVEAEADLLLRNNDDPAGLEGQFPSADQLVERWLHLMMHSTHPFQERLALFLHDHFAVSSSGLNASERHWMKSYVDTLRNEGLGNFRDLVVAMARDSAMLEWLDGTSSVKGEPNENFAREFFELFTLGADNGYTETDVQEASRAFTGYRNRLDTETNLRFTEFDPDRKDIFAKVLFDDVILRSNGEALDDFELVVDATFEHLRVDLWLAEKLLLEFVSDSPSEAQITALAAVIVAEEFEMKQVLRTLFVSEAFYAEHKAMVRGPVDFAVGFVRSTGLFVAPDRLRRELEDLAQVPGEPPSVFGWPQGPEWLSAAAMVQRANLIREIISQRDFQAQNGIEITLPVGIPDAATVVAHFAALLDVELTASEEALLIEYLDSEVRSDGSLEEDPFDPTDPDDISERVRGLLYILANHEQSMLR